MGLDRLSDRALLSTAAVVLAGPSAVAGVLAKRTWADGQGRSVLVSAELAVTVGALAAVSALASGWEPDLSWLPMAAVALLAAAAVGAGLLGLDLAAASIAVLGLLAYAAAVVATLDRLVDEPSVAALAGGSAWPVAVLLVVTSAVAARGPSLAQPVAAFVASVLAAALVLVPAEHAGRLPLTVLDSALVVALAVAGLLRLGLRMQGVRVAAMLGMAALAADLAVRAGAGVESVAAAASPVWSGGLGVRLPAVGAPPDDRVWFAIVLGGALAAAMACAREWPLGDELGDRWTAIRAVLARAAVLVAVGCLLITVLWLAWPVWVLTALAVLAAVAASSPRPLVLVPAAAVLLVGAWAAAASAGLSAVALAAVAAALLAQATRWRLDLPAAPLSGTGVVAADLALLSLTHQLGGTGPPLRWSSSSPGPWSQRRSPRGSRATRTGCCPPSVPSWLRSSGLPGRSPWQRASAPAPARSP